MELLLFLSAMLAGFTGLISGDRAVETRQFERTAVAASLAADIAAETTQAAVRVAAPRIQAPPRSAAAEPKPLFTAIELPQRAPVDERRRE